IRSSRKYGLPDDIGIDGRIGRQREVKRGTAARVGFHPDPPAMAFHHLLADRESDPRPGVLIPSVQALKDHEDSFKILRFNADAVVADGEDQVLALSAGRHVDARGLLASELDRIADKILKKLGH